MRFLLACLALSAPLLAQEAGFAYDPDFGMAIYQYEVTVTTALPGIDPYRYTEDCVLSRTEAGEIELRRNPMFPVTVPIEGGTMSVAKSLPLVSDVTCIYDREWRPLRVEGLADPFGPEFGPMLARVLGPVANAILAELDSPVGPGAMDPALFAAGWSLHPGSTLTYGSSAGVEGQGWRNTFEMTALSIDEAEGVRLARVRTNSSWELTGVLASVLGPITTENESSIHADGFPESSTWVLRVGSTELMRIERRRAEDPIEKARSDLGSRSSEIERALTELDAELERSRAEFERSMAELERAKAELDRAKEAVPPGSEVPAPR